MQCLARGEVPRITGSRRGVSCGSIVPRKCAQHARFLRGSQRSRGQAAPPRIGRQLRPHGETIRRWMRPLTLTLSQWERESGRSRREGVPSPPSAFASECGHHKLQARQGELAEKDRMRGNARCADRGSGVFTQPLLRSRRPLARQQRGLAVHAPAIAR